MSEHERTIMVNARPLDAFRYLSSVSNLPDFVPHLSRLREEEDGHVFGVADRGDGQQREVSGFFRPDEADLFIGWESDGTPGYRGWLQVAPDAGDRSRITVHISMRGAAEETPPVDHGIASERIEREFDDVMRKLQRAVESETARTRSAA